MYVFWRLQQCETKIQNNNRGSLHILAQSRMVVLIKLGDLDI